MEQEGRCPLDKLADNRQLRGEQMPPSTPNDDFGTPDPFDELTDSGKYNSRSPPDLELPLTPTNLTPTLQASSHGKKASERRFSRSESLMSKVGSPNFVYLNAAYSSSIEVLPALYAKVDRTKKIKNKKFADRSSDTELISQARRKSKSSESVLCGSPTFTHFGAFAALNAAVPSSNDSLVPMVPPQEPQVERVSIALTTSVEAPDTAEGKAECVNVPAVPEKKGSYSGEVQALERTLSELPHRLHEKNGIGLNTH